jgi:hypothetical protein
MAALSVSAPGSAAEAGIIMLAWQSPSPATRHVGRVSDAADALGSTLVYRSVIHELHDRTAAETSFVAGAVGISSVVTPVLPRAT